MCIVSVGVYRVTEEELHADEQRLRALKAVKGALDIVCQLAKLYVLFEVRLPSLTTD